MNKPFQPQRRTTLKRIFQYSVLGLFALSSPLVDSLVQSTQAQTNAKVINLAYQSSGDLVKSKKVVEPRFKALGVTVNWVGPFAAGPQLIEALNAGKVDIGNVGETPPIFSQAARPGVIPEVVYLTGRTPTNGQNQGIVVKANSSIKKVADLKGKKIAFQVGSNAQYLLAKALKELGLKFSDIQVVALTPSQARDAFIQDKADAWVGGDPLLAEVENTTPIRVLRNAAGINTLNGFYIGRRNFVTQNPQLVRVFLEEAQKVGEAAEKNPSDYAKILVTEQKLAPSVADKVARRRTYKLRRLTPAIIAEQQGVADFYFQEKVISRKIDIKEGILAPILYQAIIPDNIP
ncbi:aliphatic sulfonate ABC transporter substrate-binding protein [Nostoc sp. FACHB-152]|uniref:aliphatic sulfonate ABC transporter substrate-binding protein n=1 Tax=unclassified Nostoc TaxID=2593658 RepID=UPI0016879B65|nr:MULTISPECIES: aliphatic sulfonate ABC transporter substrate-binding protein [unclassified Nostoc]MBD2448027.1 aliphatic sulfonate ABC transporter substrate-binding protein [Nostoc sp. FACHB-152]MBD2466134.1 aliphatic sulfonate ABC transporter substrate-binding protein [Nostoc sp. FACHB-145]